MQRAQSLEELLKEAHDKLARLDDDWTLKHRQAVEEHAREKRCRELAWAEQLRKAKEDRLRNSDG